MVTTPGGAKGKVTIDVYVKVVLWTLHQNRKVMRRIKIHRKLCYEFSVKDYPKHTTRGQGKSWEIINQISYKSDTYPGFILVQI